MKASFRPSEPLRTKGGTHENNALWEGQASPFEMDVYLEAEETNSTRRKGHGSAWRAFSNATKAVCDNAPKSFSLHVKYKSFSK